MLPSKLQKGLSSPASIDSFRLPFLYNTRTIQRAYSGAADVAYDPTNAVRRRGAETEEDPWRDQDTTQTEGERTGYDGQRSHSYAKGAAAEFRGVAGIKAQGRSSARSSARRPRPKEHDIPFETSSTTGRTAKGVGGSTMTNRELRRFEELFQMGVSRTSQKLPGQQAAESKSLSSKQNRLLNRPKPEFPDLLRPLAEEAALLRAQANSNSDFAPKENNTVISNKTTSAHLDKVKQTMNKAKIDTELWQVLRSQVFKKIESLDLRDEGVDARLQAAMTEDKLRDFELLTETLPSILLHFMKLIQTYFPGSHLGLVLLPSLKKLGSFAFTLGATTELYNQHMQLLYRHYTDLDGICNTLAEMDKEVYEFDVGTQHLLDSIFKHANASRLGKNGPGLQALWLTDRKARALMKLTQWKEVVDEKVMSTRAKAKAAESAGEDLLLE